MLRLFTVEFMSNNSDMTGITPGVGATILSDSAEGQLLEVVALIKNHEKVPSKNPTNATRVSCSFNLGGGVANISFQIPATPVINETGQVVQNAATYLQNTSFAAGDGGTFKSTTIEAYLLEVATHLQIKESNTIKNPNNLNNVQVTFDSDEGIVNGTVSLPIIFEVSNGVRVLADEYLLD